jgi:pimeloyl-ACP methyl ester carboxylesterase
MDGRRSFSNKINSMNALIEMRELIALSVDGVIIRGTYHRPRAAGLNSQREPEEQTSIGILFLSGLYATRASTGDAAVGWADAFAEDGYHCFRIDLPGYGDSDGDPPEDWLGFINRGGYAQVTAAIVKQLIRRYSLNSLILAGHCAGAITAIYSAETIGAECAGLILIEPYFHLAQEAKPNIRQELRVWAERSRLGGALSGLFRAAKQALQIAGRRTLPANANVPLLQCWIRLCYRGVPILVLQAPARHARAKSNAPGHFDYMQYAIDVAGAACKLELRMIEQANHSFSNSAGRYSASRAIQNWLFCHFPRRGPGSPAASLPVKFYRQHDMQAIAMQ